MSRSIAEIQRELAAAIAAEDAAVEIKREKAFETCNREIAAAKTKRAKALSKLPKVSKSTGTRTGAGQTAHARRKITEGHLSDWYRDEIVKHESTGTLDGDKEILRQIYRDGYRLRHGGNDPEIVERYVSNKALGFLRK